MKSEVKQEDVEYMEQPHLKLKIKMEKKVEEEMKGKPNEEAPVPSIDTDYDFKLEPSLKLEPSVPVIMEE